MLRAAAVEGMAHIQACERVVKFIPSLQGPRLLLRCCTVQQLAPDVWLDRGTHPAGAPAVAPQYRSCLTTQHENNYDPAVPCTAVAVNTYAEARPFVKKRAGKRCATLLQINLRVVSSLQMRAASQVA
jgi:hypothetical protein